MVAIAGGARVSLFNSMGNAWTANYLKIAADGAVDLRSNITAEARAKIFSESLRDCGLGLLLDVVPNHMGIGNDAGWRQDVLENGRSSEFAQCFDIDWEPLKPDMQNKLLLPVLGAQYGEALEAKEIQLEVSGGRVVIGYFEHRFPVAPRTLALLGQKMRKPNLLSLECYARFCGSCCSYSA